MASSRAFPSGKKFHVDLPGDVTFVGLQDDILNVESEALVCSKNGRVERLVESKIGHDNWKKAVNTFSTFYGNLFIPWKIYSLNFKHLHKPKFEMVYTVSLPLYNSSVGTDSKWLDEYEKLMTELLKKAEKHGLSSISFTLLGTYVRAPVDKCIKRFKSALSSLKNPKTLSYVKMVVYEDEHFAKLKEIMMDRTKSGEKKNNNMTNSGTSSKNRGSNGKPTYADATKNGGSTSRAASQTPSYRGNNSSGVQNATGMKIGDAYGTSVDPKDHNKTTSSKKQMNDSKDRKQISTQPSNDSNKEKKNPDAGTKTRHTSVKGSISRKSEERNLNVDSHNRSSKNDGSRKTRSRNDEDDTKHKGTYSDDKENQSGRYGYHDDDSDVYSDIDESLVERQQDSREKKLCSICQSNLIAREKKQGVCRDCEPINQERSRHSSRESDHVSREIDKGRCQHCFQPMFTKNPVLCGHRVCNKCFSGNKPCPNSDENVSSSSSNKANGDEIQPASLSTNTRPVTCDHCSNSTASKTHMCGHTVCYDCAHQPCPFQNSLHKESVVHQNKSTTDEKCYRCHISIRKYPLPCSHIVCILCRDKPCPDCHGKGNYGDSDEQHDLTENGRSITSSKRAVGSAGQVKQKDMTNIDHVSGHLDSSTERNFKSETNSESHRTRDGASNSKECTKCYSPMIYSLELERGMCKHCYAIRCRKCSSPMMFASEIERGICRPCYDKHSSNSTIRSAECRKCFAQLIYPNDLERGMCIPCYDKHSSNSVTESDFEKYRAVQDYTNNSEGTYLPCLHCKAELTTSKGKATGQCSTCRSSWNVFHDKKEESNVNNRKCYGCFNKLSSPVTLPCRHIVCTVCATRTCPNRDCAASYSLKRNLSRFSDTKTMPTNSIQDTRQNGLTDQENENKDSFNSLTNKTNSEEGARQNGLSTQEKTKKDSFNSLTKKTNSEEGARYSSMADNENEAELLKKAEAGHDVKAEASHDVKAEASRDVKAKDSHDVKAEDSHDVKAEDSHDVKAEDSHDVKAKDSHDVKKCDSVNTGRCQNCFQVMSTEIRYKCGHIVCRKCDAKCNTDACIICIEEGRPMEKHPEPKSSLSKQTSVDATDTQSMKFKCDECSDMVDIVITERCGHDICPKCYPKGCTDESCKEDRSYDDDDFEDLMKKDEEEPQSCAICMDDITDPKTLDKCGHVFCRRCIDTSFKLYKPSCPSCGMSYGIITGNMPPGTMDVRRTADRIEGYESCGSYIITYKFNYGRQGPNHPNPGMSYRQTTRVAYLPASPEGVEVCKMLKEAFRRRLTFTIGRSTTTGSDNVITWNDIHHKTSINGGPTNFGYPDDGYLSRVKDELASKGITENDIGGVHGRSETIYVY